MQALSTPGLRFRDRGGWGRECFIAAGDGAVDALVDRREDVVVRFGVVVALIDLLGGEVGESELWLLVIGG